MKILVNCFLDPLGLFHKTEGAIPPRSVLLLLTCREFATKFVASPC